MQGCELCYEALGEELFDTQKLEYLIDIQFANDVESPSALVVDVSNRCYADE